MDEVQKKVSRITDLIPNCLSNRRILQSGLSDILADDRLHLNLLMAAYDENIVGKLSGEKDSTVAANYLVRQLDWFEDNVSYLLEVFELTPKQLKLIDLTDKQRREWSS